MSSKQIAIPCCGSCGGGLLVHRYRAATGDLLFAGGSEVIDSHTDPVQVRSLYLCPSCDRIELMPAVKP